MSWLERFVRPKIQALVSKEAPDNLWIKCTSCGQMIFHRELTANQRVCTHCGHHMRISIRDRLAALYDDADFEEIAQPKITPDPLKFRDRKRYADRLRDAKSKLSDAGVTEQQDAIIVAKGTIGGLPLVVAGFDFSFMGGSMGVAVGEAIVAAARLAVDEQAALLLIPASGGARMQEGILSLMQMPRTTIGVDMVKEAGLPYVVLLTDPTTGGVSASFAMLGDIQIAEPGAVIGFAGKRVIEETIRENLPEGFQTAEYLLDHGMVDMVVPRQDLRDSLIGLLRHLMRPLGTGDVVSLPTRKKARPSKTQPALTEVKSGKKKAAKKASAKSGDKAAVPAIAAPESVPDPADDPPSKSR